jgi:hypothetical protein
VAQSGRLAAPLVLCAEPRCAGACGTEARVGTPGPVDSISFGGSLGSYDDLLIYHTR